MIDFVTTRTVMKNKQTNETLFWFRLSDLIILCVRVRCMFLYMKGM